jgi:Ca-activated chloride channel family protein
MSLTWPWALAALLAFPALLGLRAWLRRRRRRDAVRVSSVTLIRAALPGPSSWRRRIPLWLFAAALLVLGVGAGRPQASVLVPAEASAIVLAMDMSGSMCSNDIEPNRLTVAQEAAKAFIEAQPEGAKIGLIGFAGHATVLVAPTANKQELIDAVYGIRTSRGTAIGLGILSSLDAIAEINPEIPPTGVDLPVPPDPAGIGFQPDTIVVLTDGANTQGVHPIIAAQQAAARGVRVYTIGFGTTEPSAFVCTMDQVGSFPWGGRGLDYAGNFAGGGFGGRRFQEIDEESLTAVADITGGEYFQARDAEALNTVLQDLPSNIVLQRRDAELTVWFALGGAVLATAAVGLTLWWRRPQAYAKSGGKASTTIQAHTA